MPSKIWYNNYVMFVNYLNYVLVKLFFLKLSLYLYLLCFSFVSIYHFW